MTEPSKLFQQASAIARANALPVLRERAIAGGFVSVVCRTCNAFVEDVAGDVSGLSLGMCSACFESVDAVTV